MKKMNCLRCGSKKVASIISYCRECLLESNGNIRKHLEKVHKETREKSSLPGHIFRKEGLPQCKICSRNCQPLPGEKGYCGLRENRGGKLFHMAGIPSRGLLEYYYDSLPTNCVADWVCPARDGDYKGKVNLAVFYGACTLNCLFCQNWQYRRLTRRLGPLYSSEELASKVDKKTACICFFGGDPAPQLPHALSTARKALAVKPDLKICWETSGLMTESYLAKIIDVSLHTGGTVKFDLKAYNKDLFYALTGGDNSQVLKNFAICAKISREKGVTLAVASTLLIPGYIEEKEVYSIASFIASIDPNIPYSLLGFYPHFHMRDLPLTSRKEAEECYRAAKKAGLKRVRLANEHLLW